LGRQEETQEDRLVLANFRKEVDENGQVVGIKRQTGKKARG